MTAGIIQEYEAHFDEGFISVSAPSLGEATNIAKDVISEYWPQAKKKKINVELAKPRRKTRPRKKDAVTK